ncbi:hypothetical protein [Nonomuraea terrae]|uniref:hypothetical protein n=1 Tax=Nonomuraea terrae TaxID=2530383 RepID=UPI00140444FB|nr:hypothetical protein [Nonomuraea terrae]
MRRAAIVLGLLPALLAAAACGAEQPPDRPAEAAAAQSAPVSPPEESPPEETPSAESTPESTSEELPSGPRTVRVADGLRARIDWPADPDPLLKLMVDQYVGTRRAIAERERGYGHNMEMDAEIQATEWIREFVDKGQTMRGLGRVYNLKVASVVGKGAQINACVDETGIRLVSESTGKAVPRPPAWLGAPYGESVIAHRGDDGVWRIRSYAESNERCTR